MLNEGLLALSEIILSSYPLLIKLVDASVFLQTGIRMFTYTALAFFAAIASGSPIGNFVSTESMLAGLLNLVHVGSSYFAFDQLAGGNAMALFYTYPVWNILGAASLFNETIPVSSMKWIALAFLGAICLAQPSKQYTAIGVFSALLAAITETCIYLWFRTKDEKSTDQPWTKMIQMYGTSGFLWAILAALVLVLFANSSNLFQIHGSGFGTIVAFNALVGFVGYALRFYLIPKVSTITFSALSFIGIFAAYAMGWLFTNELPTVIQAVGATAIVVANTILLRREIV